MEAHLHTWLSLLLRWIHVIAGVAWIGTSFYFSWLENRLRQLGQHHDIADELRGVQGGGFNYLRSLAIAPEALPAQLEWFKRAAYTSWITGILMLVVIYYWQASSYMVDTAIADIPVQLAVLSGIATLLLSWLFYDLLCRSPLARNELLLGVLIFGWFGVVTWALTQLLSGHAAYLHVGATLGTIMVANVFHMISPAQKDLVQALTEGRSPDSAQAELALQRSRHNSYFALPVVFIMISGHYPVTYGHVYNWLALLLISLVAVAIRHYFNMLHEPGSRLKLWLPAGAVLAALIFVTIPQPRPAQESEEYGPPWLDNVRSIIQQRCQHCHSTMPQFVGIAAAPLGIELDSQAEVLKYADRLYEMTVVSKTMPPDNATHMTEEERQTIAGWYAMVQHYRAIQQEVREKGETNE